MVLYIIRILVTCQSHIKFIYLYIWEYMCASQYILKLIFRNTINCNYPNYKSMISKIYI